MTSPNFPFALPTLADAYVEKIPEAAQIHIGRVVGFSPAGGLVVTAEDSNVRISAGWLRGSYEPVLGDNVVLARQGASWVALGAIASGFGAAEEAVQNYSFENSPAGAAPAGWTVTNLAGSSTLQTYFWNSVDFVDGAKVGAILANSATATNVEVSSFRIPTEPGWQWGLGAWYRAGFNFGMHATVCTARLFASWYTSTGALVSEESHGTYFVVRGMPWRLMRENGNGDGAVAPPDAAYLRAKLKFQWTALASDIIYIDMVTARRVG